MRSKPATQYIAWRNRMRTQHPNLWHPIRFAIMLIVIASIGDLFTPYAHLGNSLPVQLYAYGMLAYSTNAIIVATLLIYYVVNILLIDPLTQIPTPSPWSACMPWCYCLVGR